MSELGGKQIGVLGLARSGRAAARLALVRGARVYASDLCGDDDRRRAAEEVRGWGGEAEAGRHDTERLAGCDLLVVSPGIPLDAPVLADQRLANIPRVSELELALGELTSPVVAVTGTNGKSTVTALISHLLTSAGREVPAAGNIGTPLSEIPLRAKPPDAVAIEVSSFQLALTGSLKAAVGVFTNLSPDHLDRYQSVEEYYADKERFFLNADSESRWVVNGDDHESLLLSLDKPGKHYTFRAAKPLLPFERGAHLDLEERLVFWQPKGSQEVILPVSELNLLGRHNAANALAAALAVRLMGVATPRIAEGLRSFSPLPHRLEPVAERGGVLWINDSKATNVASARVAVLSMTRPTVLLLGGRHKGEPYGPVLAGLPSPVRSVVAYGEAAEQIENDLKERVPVRRVEDGFDAAVAVAGREAGPGDAVLLSPACSSYDLFRDFEERGERFAQLAGGGR
ncbi:MAG: UDP-N-acetylmuramoyl-L-alanine--D-glutamate ligase [Longimicrobiaceae bacterium]